MRKEIASIRAAMKRGDFAKARKLVTRSLKTEPNSRLYLLASRLSTDPQEAEVLLQDGLKLDPYNARLHAALSKLQAKKQKDAASASRYMLMLPEHAPPVEGIEYASILSRICAQVIDAIIFVVASQVLGFIFGIIVGLFLLPNPYRVVTVEEYEAAVVIWTNRYVVGYVLLATLYYFYYLVRYDGQTPGKSLMKIRIVRQDGEHFTLPDAVIRNLIGYPVSTLLLFSGHLWAIADPKRQTLHDKMTQTVVLKDRFVYNNIRAEQNL